MNANTKSSSGGSGFSIDQMLIFNTSDAIAYGVTEALLLARIRMRANINNRGDGRSWLRASAKQLATELPYLSATQVARLLRSLCAQGALIKGSFNDDPSDHTNWYSIAHEKMS